MHVIFYENFSGRCYTDRVLCALCAWSVISIKHDTGTSIPLLASLATGVVVSAAVNYDDALSVGESSMKAMEGKRFSGIHLQRRNNVRSLASVTKAVKVRVEDVCINPNQLCHRIVCIARSGRGACRVFNIRVGSMPPGPFR